MSDSEQMREWSDDLSAAWERHRTLVFEFQRPVSEWLIDRIDPQPGQTVLELAAGPGETGFLAAERVGPTGRLISTDLGPGMVGAAQRGAAERGLQNVEHRVMDAQDPDLPDASVDGALCRFGIMLMPEPDRALAATRRLLRDGGRFAYAVWGAADRNPWMMMLGLAVLENGHAPPGNPFEAGGPFSLADPARNQELITGAGFTDPEVQELPGTMPFESFDQFWEVQTQLSGPLALFIGSLPEDDRAAIRSTLEPLVQQFASGAGYEFPTLAVAVAATAG